MNTDLLNLFQELDDSSDSPVTREQIVRAAFAWPGCKLDSIPKLKEFLPYRKVWVDCTGGSGVVTAFRAKSELDVYNDRHSGLTAFFRCIRDQEKQEKLISNLRLMLHSREEFLYCRDNWENQEDELQRATMFYYSVYYSFQSLGRNFGRVLTTSNMLAAKFENSFPYFPALHERFKSVQIENLDVLQILNDYDSYDTVFYLDPDYLGTNAIYEHTVDHKKLLNKVFECKGFVAISGYQNDLYDSYKWDQKEKWTVNSTMKPMGNSVQWKNKVVERGTADEVLWIKH